VSSRDGREAETAGNPCVKDVGPKAVGVDDVRCQSAKDTANRGAFSEIGARRHDDVLDAHIGLPEAVGQRIVSAIAPDADDVDPMASATLDDGQAFDHAFEPPVLTGLEGMNDRERRLDAGGQRWSFSLFGVDERDRERRHERRVGNRYAGWSGDGKRRPAMSWIGNAPSAGAALLHRLLRERAIDAPTAPPVAWSHDPHSTCCIASTAVARRRNHLPGANHFPRSDFHRAIGSIPMKLTICIGAGQSPDAHPLEV
jgi:hypothetical protein